MNCKIYVNGKLLGYCSNPIEFTQEMREKRRNGKISHEMNITYYEDSNEVYIFTDPGRARRPLIIVKHGIPLLRDDHLNRISKGTLKWDDLINKGIIEFLDAEEEENSYIAMTLADLTEDHTHLEIDPATMLGICAGIIPFSNHNSSPRNTMEAGMVKQALGLFASNYALRTDTRAHLLHHPQTPIVKTRIIDSTNYDLRPSGQNFVVALMSYEGYNMEDAMVINKAALERGLARSSFFRAYDTSEKRYAGGQVDRFEVPNKNIKGYRSKNAYGNLDDDGLINPESYVESGDVLIGKTSPPRFLEEDFGTVADLRRETSVTVRHGEKGIVDAVLLSETVEGSRLAKIRVRDTRQPEFGDKFASRHGQKGVIGLIVSPEDLPFSEFGVVPDLIVNPHAIPSRMSMGYILEMIAGKAGCLEGMRVDATPFNENLEQFIGCLLVNNGFELAGCESLYDGKTGERFEAEIFIGVSYYQKLHHMTTDKVYARSRGPVQVLTRQPTEGRAREGGLRFGEMERDCLIAHGAAITLKERLLDESDKYEAIVCNNCGMLAVYDKNKNKKYCPICGYVDTYPIEIAYSFKLLLDELYSLCVYPKLILEDKINPKKQIKKRFNIPYKPPKRNNIISGPRLVEEEPSEIEPKIQIGDIFENCEICGKKLNKNQKRICKSCARKQYAARIIKKLVSAVKPGIPFKKQDLKFLDLDDIQIKDYMWTLQEFNLVEIDGNKFMLKDEKILNEFRIACKFEPIDFDNLDSEDRLDKTCKTCGKTLPISKFYETSNGYEDNCKNCKKLIVTANYLNDIINNIGFNKEFSGDDLSEYISNPNQLMGIIWSLQENDLLIQNSSNLYILEDKSKCIKFLEEYHDNSTSNISQDKKDQSNEKEQMKSVLKVIKTGKTRKEAARITNISLDKISYWYIEGKRGSGTDNIQFYKRLKKIEDDLSNKNNKSLEKSQMDFILKLLSQGKSMSQVSDISGIKITKILSWVNQGKENYSEDTIYFYNEMNKVMDDNEKTSKENIKNKFSSKKNKKGKKKLKKETKRSKTSKNKKKSKGTKKDSSSNEERMKMDIVLNALRDGKSRNDAANEAGISITKISSWEMNGNFRYNENTIYFVNEMSKIAQRDENSKNNIKSKRVSKKNKVSDKKEVDNGSKKEKIQSVKQNKPKIKNKNKQSKIDTFKSQKIKRNSLKGSNLSKVIKSAADAINSLDNDEDIGVTDNFNIINKTDLVKNIKIKPNTVKKVNSNEDKQIKQKTSKSSQVGKIELNDERQVMDDILSLMRKGYSRVQASQEVGIKVGQIVIWHMQGRNNHSDNTVYFYNQLNLIEKK